MPIRIRLELDADTARLQEAIQKAVVKGFQGGGTGGLASNPQSAIDDIMGNKVPGQGMKRRSIGNRNIVTPSSPDFLTNPQFFFTKNIPPTIQQHQQQQQAQMASFIKNMGFAGIPLLKPTSVFGNLFAARQIFSGVSGPVGQRALGAIGLGGTGASALATGGIMATLLAIGVAFKVLTETIKQTARTFDEARKLYAKSLQSGLGLRFTATRQNLADVLGVSERDVYQFGKAIAFIGPKLQFASQRIADTTPNLTSVAYEFEILKKDLQALFMTIANDVAPALRLFISGLESFVNGLTGMVDKIGAAFKAHPWLAKMAGVAMAGFFAPIAPLLIAGAKNNSLGPAPFPQSFMKQLPVSALERMGLVIPGYGGAGDYSQQIARNTKETAMVLKNMAGKLIPRTSSSYFFSPMGNNP